MMETWGVVVIGICSGVVGYVLACLMTGSAFADLQARAWKAECRASAAEAALRHRGDGA